MWELIKGFFEVMILPFLVVGIILAALQVTLYKFADKITDKNPKLHEFLESRPKLVLEIAGICLIIYVLYSWITNGTGVENTGF